MENTDTPTPLCPNCAQPLPAPDVIFCPHCGQKNSDGKVSMRDFLGRFFQHFTHLDNKFVRTVHDLFVPGKMTDIYFRGKRKRYPHPVQLFFIVMFFFLLMANHYVGQSGAIQVAPSSEKVDGKMRGTTFFDQLQRQAHSLRLRQLVDSLPPTLRDAHAREAIDSLLLRSHDAPLRSFQQLLLMADSAAQTNRDNRWRDSVPPDQLWRNWSALDSITIGLGYRSYLFSLVDLATLSEEALLEKYRVEGAVNRILVKQGIKTSHNPAELMKFYAGSFSWTVLVLVAVMAAFMRLLYWRQRRYYVEHFVFLMHWHSALLLLAALLLAIKRFSGGDTSSVALTILPVWVFGSFFWASKRYYHTGLWATTWRWMAFWVVYTLAFAVFFTLGLLVALLLF